MTNGNDGWTTSPLLSLGGWYPTPNTSVSEGECQMMGRVSAF